LENKKFQGDFYKDTAYFDSLLPLEISFDVKKREIQLINGKAIFYFITTFLNEDMLQRQISLIENMDKSGDNSIKNLINIPDVELTDDINKAKYCLFCGQSVLFYEKSAKIIILDTRNLPIRSPEEPESDKTLRGAHIGFVEVMAQNTALIRRYIRDENFICEKKTIGTSSMTDVVLCYMKNRVNAELLNKISQKLDSIQTGDLAMSQQSIAEAIIKKKWYNPFPKIRYTERPDVAAAHIFEGMIIIITDNSPSAMILPTTFFDFFQETDDYYFSPFVGKYLRFIRQLTFILTIFLTPLWYLFISNEWLIPKWLDFIKVMQDSEFPIIVQLFIAELAIDGLRLASLNTPSGLNGALSAVAGLILGDFAVQAGIFVPETILYMAFVTIANFTQPSYELGYAFKFIRLLLLILTAIFGLFGFLGGLFIIFVLLLTNESIDESKSYLYPLIPFSPQKLKRLLTLTKKK